MKAQNLGTTPLPPDTPLAGSLDSLNKTMDRAQDQWEEDNKNMDHDPKKFALAFQQMLEDDRKKAAQLRAAKKKG